jgi:hypothetical protein
MSGQHLGMGAAPTSHDVEGAEGGGLQGAGRHGGPPILRLVCQPARHHLHALLLLVAEPAQPMVHSRGGCQKPARCPLTEDLLPARVMAGSVVSLSCMSLTLHHKTLAEAPRWQSP